MGRKIHKRIAMVLLLVSLCVALLSGCMSISADDLYSLPQLSEEYLLLQSHINSILNQGAELSPLTGGVNRQAVQLIDLDGDGVDEVLAFFSFPSSSTLTLYIFKAEDKGYSIAEVIQGIGTAFESVRFVDMDGDGVMEIVVGWQMGPALRHLEIFSIRDYHAVSIMRTEYTELTEFDLTGNGNNDIIVVRSPTQESGAVIAVYTLMPDGEIVLAEAKLSTGIEMFVRVLTGRLTDGVPAVFIESDGRFEDGGIITDICVFLEEGLVNITVKGSNGVSEETIRTHMNSSDINGDGVIEIPMPRLLRAQSETDYYAIDWYAFGSNGHSSLALTTYHNNNDEWYLILPFDWRGMVSLRREDGIAGERTVVFSSILEDDDIYNDFLRIYKITGDLRENRATLPGRLRLTEEGSAVYAFELLAPPNSFGLTFDEHLIRSNFRLMYLEWLVGSG